MKRITCFYFLFLLFVNMRSQNWQQLPNFPAAGRDDGSVFIIGNNVYCGLGNASGVGPSTDFHKFNPLNDTWPAIAVASLPTIGRQYCCSFSYNNYGYIIGGIDANWQASNLVWRYDTATNNWSPKTSVPDSVQGAVCFFINNKAYICGGRDRNNNCTKKVWEYDVINDTWLQKNNMPQGGRWRASGTVINNKGYLVFGADSANKFSNKLFEYNPIGDTWMLVDSFPGLGRTYASAFNANNLFVIALGIDSNVSLRATTSFLI
jgi:N-acetylneuraminic acid mutarotase